MNVPLTAPELIRAKRDGRALDASQIDAFAKGLADGTWSDAQVGAMAMAICLRGLTNDETAALTRAMTRSGDVLDWRDAGLPGPVLDKHSTGGVGDKTSLLIAPIVAACGGCVPMISGRGLGHTGGTLDKLESIPGYRVAVDAAGLRHAVASAGCAIVGATDRIAPADRRLYAIRDLTATVDSLPLIVASILSKKLAAGVSALVIDVKTGNGAFMAAREDADALARALVRVADAAGLPARAWVTDMDSVLGRSCGNALEVLEAVAFLEGRRREPRLLEVTRALCAELLLAGGLASAIPEALGRVDAVLADGSALERFARMVAVLGGPADFTGRPLVHLPEAPVQRAVLAARSGWITGMATRAIGELTIDLGGGRRHAGDRVDPRVGFAEIAPVGQRVAAGDVLAIVHAADAGSAATARDRFAALVTIGEEAPPARPVLIDRSTAAGPEPSSSLPSAAR